MVLVPGRESAGLEVVGWLYNRSLLYLFHFASLTRYRFLWPLHHIYHLIQTEQPKVSLSLRLRVSLTILMPCVYVPCTSVPRHF